MSAVALPFGFFVQEKIHRLYTVWHNAEIFLPVVLSIIFLFSKNRFLYRKKKSRNNIWNLIHNFVLKKNTIDVASHKLAMVTLFIMDYEQN